MTDDDGGKRGAPAIIDVNSPPDCSTVAPSLSEPWPVNHTLRPHGFPSTIHRRPGDLYDHRCPGRAAQRRAMAIMPDAQDGHADQVNLRAERSGNGDGRVYRRAVTVSDGRGGFCTRTINVTVPHSKNGDVAIDSGLVVNSK